MKLLISAGNITAIGLTALVLAGCSTTKQSPATFEPQTTVRVVTHTVYPQLSQINIPAKPELRDFKFDLPRMMDEPQIVKNTEECIGVPVEEQDMDFWEECGIYPVDPNSNIFVGLDQENFNNVMYNFDTLKAHIERLEGRIALGNEQRAAFEKQAGRSK